LKFFTGFGYFGSIFVPKSVQALPVIALLDEKKT